MGKKENWENEYQKYSSSIPTELEKRLEKLTKSLEDKLDKNEDAKIAEYEYAEYEKLTDKKAKIEANLPKVKNILELREKLNKEIEQIKAEIETRNGLTEINKKNEELEQDMLKLEKEYTDLQKEIKGKDGKEREEIQRKIDENANKRQENNREFMANQDKFKEASEKANKDKNNEYKKMSMEELKDNVTQASIKISKCNIASNILMQGRSWDDVEIALERYEQNKLKAKGEQAKKIKQNREAIKAANVKVKQTKAQLTTKKENEKQEETALEVPTRWQKIKNWTKNVWGKLKEQFVEQEEQEDPKDSNEATKIEEKITFWQKVKNWFNGDEEKDNLEQLTEQTEPKETEPKETEKKESFRDYLRDIAEKGIDGVEQEKADAEKAAKESKMKAAREKLEANRAEALKREAARDNQNGDER